jgi:hypothetical protein
MKILAFVDSHGIAEVWDILKQKVIVKNPDLIICGGDITIFESRIEEEMKYLSELGKPVLVIHGNHETSNAMLREAEKYNNITFLHKKWYREGGYLFFGYGGGGFSLVDVGFEKIAKRFAKEIKEGDKVVLITHGPPFDTTIDLIEDDHVGCKSYRKFIDKHDIPIVISGHLHENSGVIDIINGKKIINPGPEGLVFDV